MNKQYGRADLARIAAKDMADRGLTTEFSTSALKQLAAFEKPSQEFVAGIRDANIGNLSSLLWCSIDNEKSRDLDQLTVCERLPIGVRAVTGMDEQIRAQDAVSQKLRKRRFEQGALEFRTIQSRTIFSGDQVVVVKLMAAGISSTCRWPVVWPRRSATYRSKSQSTLDFGRCGTRIY